MVVRYVGCGNEAGSFWLSEMDMLVPQLAKG